MISIRRGNFADVGPILGLSSVALDEGVWAPVKTVDIGHSMRLLSTQVENNLVFVADGGGGVVGMIVLRVDGWAWNPSERHLESIHFYVHPAFRSAKTSDGKLAAVALIDAAKGVAQRAGLDLILTVLFGDDVERRDAFIRRQGIKSAGETLVFQPKAIALPIAAE